MNMPKMNQKGFTFIEIMVSVGIFAIGLTSIFALHLDSLKAAKRSTYMYTAYNLAKNRIETLKNLSFSALSSAAETSTYLTADGVPDSSGQYIRSSTVSTSYSGDANLTQLSVSVYYVMQGGQSTQPVTLTTVLYNGG